MKKALLICLIAAGSPLSGCESETLDDFRSNQSAINNEQQQIEENKKQLKRRTEQIKRELKKQRQVKKGRVETFKGVPKDSNGLDSNGAVDSFRESVQDD